MTDNEGDASAIKTALPIQNALRPPLDCCSWSGLVYQHSPNLVDAVQSYSMVHRLSATSLRVSPDGESIRSVISLPHSKADMGRLSQRSGASRVA